MNRKKQYQASAVASITLAASLPDIGFGCGFFSVVREDGDAAEFLSILPVEDVNDSPDLQRGCPADWEGDGGYEAREGGGGEDS